MYDQGSYGSGIKLGFSDDLTLCRDLKNESKLSGAECAKNKELRGTAPVQFLISNILACRKDWNFLLCYSKTSHLVALHDLLFSWSGAGRIIILTFRMKEPRL